MKVPVSTSLFFETLQLLEIAKKTYGISTGGVFESALNIYIKRLESGKYLYDAYKTFDGGKLGKRRSQVITKISVELLERADKMHIKHNCSAVNLISNAVQSYLPRLINTMNALLQEEESSDISFYGLTRHDNGRRKVKKNAK